jgi:8-oxo-dGTP diphosphatase
MGAQEQGIDPTRWMVIPRTLCFVTHENDVLLLKRAAHKRAFPNRYNGIGGHLERDEDPLSGALREIHEETGLTVHTVRFRGITHIDAGQDVGIVLFVFTALADSRDFTDSDEGTLHWVPIAEVGNLALVDDLPLLLPRLFGPGAAQSPFFAHVSYDGANHMVLAFSGQES